MTKQIVAKTSKTKKIIENKIIYVEDTLYCLNLPTDLKPDVSIGQTLEENDPVKSKESNVEPEVQEIEYKGKTQLEAGDYIETGQELYTRNKLIGKESISSPVSGRVKEVTEDLIKIEIQPDTKKEILQFKSPFGGKVKTITESYLLLEYPAVQVNLFESKGGSAVGPIKYLSSAQIKDRKNLSRRVDKSIVVTDHLTSDLYPMLSTLGVGAIIANSIDYSLYRNMIILAVPVGIITGYGFTPPEISAKSSAGAKTAVTYNSEAKPLLSEDETLIKYIKSIEGKTVWFDGDYSRLVIPETKEPIYLKRHLFQLW